MSRTLIPTKLVNVTQYPIYFDTIGDNKPDNRYCINPRQTMVLDIDSNVLKDLEVKYSGKISFRKA